MPYAAAYRLAHEQLAERQAREQEQMREARVQMERNMAELRLQTQLLRGPWGFGERPVEDQAKGKARETLIRFMNEEQRRSYLNNNYFLVVGSEGNTYRIETNRSASGNVIWVQGGADRPPYQTLGGQYCAYPLNRTPDGKLLPKEDQFLGQMLQLVTDENSYLARANVFAGTFPPTYRHPDVNHQTRQRCECEFCAAARLEYGVPRRGHRVVLQQGGREVAVEVRFEW
jgi:hypothetical protein